MPSDIRYDPPVRHEHSSTSHASNSCYDAPFRCLTMTRNFRLWRKPLKELVRSQQSQHFIGLNNGNRKERTAAKSWLSSL